MDLARFNDPSVAQLEAATLDIGAGVEGRTRIETVKVKLGDEIRKHLL